MVKKQAKGYELSKLIELKEGKNASKLANLSYEKLCPQEYLFKLDVKVAKDVFRYRTRMMHFSGNFRGQGPIEFCPLCQKHEDLQELSFKCPAVLEKINVNEEYVNIFGSDISQNLGKTLSEIAKMRKKET